MTATLAATIDEFRAAMQRAGLDASGLVIQADGILHRFHIPGDRSGSVNGWYVLHVGPRPSGAFGSWRAALSVTWRPKRSDVLTLAELERIRAAVEEARRVLKLEREAGWAAAASLAQDMWQDGTEPAQHPYLARKGVGAYGIRERHGRLLIPLRDASGALFNLQSIRPDGEKRFLRGGRVNGLYHAIGSAVTDELCIAEGYATAASVHEATGLPVAVAFNARNLEGVARALRQKFPSARLVICADNDADTAARIGKNPGIEAARRAALAVGGVLAVPDFTHEVPA